MAQSVKRRSVLRQRWLPPLAYSLLVLLLPLAACTQSPVPTTVLATSTPTSTVSSATPTISATSTMAITPTVPLATPTQAVAGSPSATISMTSCAPGVDLLGFSDALNKTHFANTNVGGLSGLVYDAAHDHYYSLVDNERDTPARFYTLRLPLANGAVGPPAIVAVTTLRDPTGKPYTGRTFDGEAIAVLTNGDLLIASETEPSIRRFTPDGQERGQLPVPTRFLVKPNGEATGNLTFESLALTPDQQTLYTANEGPLTADGLTGMLQPRLRILQYTAQPDWTPTAEYFYLAEPAQGLAEIVALGPTELLILERGFVPNVGNTIRLFRVSLQGAVDVSDRASLTDPQLTPLPKTLLADLVNCPAGSAQSPESQLNPLLDNIESVTLGPRLADQRQTLVLQSDDNFAAEQVTRFYVLAFQP